MALIMLSVTDANTWTWVIAIAVLLAGGFWFLDRLMRRGLDNDDPSGSSNLGSAVSNLQTLVDPGHRHAIEERERKRGEHDDAGDPPETNQ